MYSSWLLALQIFIFFIYIYIVEFQSILEHFETALDLLLLLACSFALAVCVPSLHKLSDSNENVYFLLLKKKGGCLKMYFSC